MQYAGLTGRSESYIAEKNLAGELYSWNCRVICRPDRQIRKLYSCLEDPTPYFGQRFSERARYVLFVDIAVCCCTKKHASKTMSKGWRLYMPINISLPWTHPPSLQKINLFHGWLHGQLLWLHLSWWGMTWPHSGMVMVSMQWASG